MKLIDTNLLLYSYDPNSAFHRRARTWLENTLASQEHVGIPMLCIAGFLRISTDSRLPKLNLRMSDALAAVESWMACDVVTVLHTTDADWDTTLRCVAQGRVSGGMFTDAQIAALALRHGAIVCTADTDFARFPGLRWVNPLERRA